MFGWYLICRNMSTDSVYFRKSIHAFKKHRSFVWIYSQLQIHTMLYVAQWVEWPSLQKSSVCISCMMMRYAWWTLQCACMIDGVSREGVNTFPDRSNGASGSDRTLLSQFRGTEYIHALPRTSQTFHHFFAFRKCVKLLKWSAGDATAWSQLPVEHHFRCFI